MSVTFAYSPFPSSEISYNKSDKNEIPSGWPGFFEFSLTAFNNSPLNNNSTMNFSF
ncbi:MAG: hypothetical protein O6940_01210 [Ignavibacteria bacterium]|nr:hypothetical protein [Ignavibacteria bacterium]